VLGEEESGEERKGRSKGEKRERKGGERVILSWRGM
jgi:hypothetical protein